MPSFPLTSALLRRPQAGVLRDVAGPRHRRDVRHDLSTILFLAVTEILAGCRSLTAIWKHAADLTAGELGTLSLETGRALPSESTIRRVLQDTNPGGLGSRLTSWFCTRTGTIEGRTVIAVDGKTMRGWGPHRQQPGTATSWRPWTRPRESSWGSTEWRTSPTRGPRPGGWQGRWVRVSELG